MLMFHPSALPTRDRPRQLLPLVLAAVVLGAMQAKLLPVPPVLLDIPTTLGMTPGAAPQESVAPPSPAAPPSAALPSESLPPVEAPSAAIDSGASPPGAQRIFPGAVGAAEAWTDRLPRTTETAGGSGSLRTRPRQPTAVTILVAGIVKSLNRLHPSEVLSAKARAIRMAALKPPPRRIPEPAFPMRAQPSRSNLTGGAVGGGGPQRNILGGPAFFASRYAPIVNGAAPGRYR